MTAFDPTPHIQQQYSKGNESLYNVTKLNRMASKKGILKKGNESKVLNLTTDNYVLLEDTNKR